jgi:trimethylamine:corrinoid methyltransferase-like protein
MRSRLRKLCIIAPSQRHNHSGQPNATVPLTISGDAAPRRLAGLIAQRVAERPVVQLKVVSRGFP